MTWPRLLVKLQDGSSLLFPEGPRCLVCKHHPCPCCFEWCDNLDSVQTDGFGQCCDGKCRYKPDEYEEWSRAFFETTEGLEVVETEPFEENYVYTPEVSFPCMFCGGTAGAGHTDSGTPAVVHTLPHCETFEKLDPLDYLRANRLAYERQA